MKPENLFFPVVMACTFCNSATGALIAHYTFDGTLADSGTSGGALTLGSAAALTSGTVPWNGVNVGDIVSATGSGAIRLTGPSKETLGSDGAVSANSFNWGATGLNSDVRSIAFWMRADGTQDSNATMISLGVGTGTGNRFDVRLGSGGNLRVELQGGGTTTTAAVGGGDWFHVTISVPNTASTLANISYFVHDTNANLISNGSGSMTGGTVVATGTGPLRIGDSYQDNSRDFLGLLDDVRLYDTALTVTDAAALAGSWSPQMAIPEPAAALLGGLGLLTLLRRRRIS